MDSINEQDALSPMQLAKKAVQDGERNMASFLAVALTEWVTTGDVSLSHGAILREIVKQYTDRVAQF